MKLIILPLLLLVACSHPSKSDSPFLPAPEDLSAFSAQADALTARLIASHLEQGQVVSRRGIGGTPQHLGDSLLWTAVAMGILPCDTAQPLEDALARQVADNGGFVRFNPLPPEYKDNRISMDGITGVVFGAARRLSRCPGRKDGLRALWQPGDEAIMGGITLGWDALSEKLGTAGAPGKDDKTQTETAALAYIAANMASRTSCFRTHIALLNLIAADQLGYHPNEIVKPTLCGLTANSDNPFLDWLCNRKPARIFLENFQTNEWEYRLQRCGAWETPDGEGLETPALDFLVLYHLAKEGD